MQALRSVPGLVVRSQNSWQGSASGEEEEEILITNLVDSLAGGVSTEVAPDLLTSSTGGGAGRERPRPPDKPPSLLETGGAVPAADPAVVQHLPAPQSQVAADTVAVPSQAD